jgi:hypothetical protein
MFGSRRPDGQPETPAETRLINLRQSGYNGPVNQDGYKVTGGKSAEILKALADERGEDTSWWNGK